MSSHLPPPAATDLRLPTIGSAFSAAAVSAGPAAGAQPLSRLHRVYFGFVASFALWVGVWGSFVPARVAKALPWPVPPLHSRVIGAMYLSGLVLMALCWRRRWTHEVAVGLRMASVWTGMLLLASLLHLDQFDPANPRVWFWFFAYVSFPLCGAWLIWGDRAALQTAPVAAPAPRWVALTLAGLGGLFCALAALLLLAPQLMQAVWPWKASVLLLQIYAGPCLSLGLGSLLLLFPRHGVEIESTTLGMVSFVALVLLASILHHELFDPKRVATTLWFAGLVLASVAWLAVLLAMRAPRR